MVIPEGVRPLKGSEDLWLRELISDAQCTSVDGCVTWSWFNLEYKYVVCSNMIFQMFPVWLSLFL